MAKDQLFDSLEGYDQETTEAVIKYNLLTENMLRMDADRTKLRIFLQSKGVNIDPHTGQAGSTRRRVVQLKDLRRQIVNLLVRNGRVMTSPQIASELWKEEFGFSMDKMVRRVIVTSSAMSKMKPPQLLNSGIAEDRAYYWAIPSWMEGGVLQEDKKPLSQSAKDQPKESNDDVT